jgi:hypothetical protein
VGHPGKPGQKTGLIGAPGAEPLEPSGVNDDKGEKHGWESPGEPGQIMPSIYIICLTTPI